MDFMSAERLPKMSESLGIVRSLEEHNLLISWQCLSLFLPLNKDPLPVGRKKIMTFNALKVDKLGGGWMLGAGEIPSPLK